MFFFITCLLIESTHGQGSPVASIGAYITNYREKQKRKEARRTSKKPTRRVLRVCDGAQIDHYNNPCRPYGYFRSGV